MAEVAQDPDAPTDRAGGRCSSTLPRIVLRTTTGDRMSTAAARLRPDGLVRSPAFSHVAIIPPGATTVLVGGQNGVDGDGRLVAEDMAGQAARTFDNLERALDAAGAAMADVVHLRVHVVAGADLGAGFAEFQRRWGDTADPPLVTVTVVAGLAVPGTLVEIDAVAALPAAAGG
jgi:enamine deaminase RidA (YjgF/YER057c/UK114 family)